jgi:hypothetical protein
VKASVETGEKNASLITELGAWKLVLPRDGGVAGWFLLGGVRGRCSSMVGLRTARGSVEGPASSTLEAESPISVAVTAGGGGALMALGVETGRGKMVDLGRLVGVSLIRFRTTAASPTMLTSSPDSHSAGRLGVFRGVEGALGRVARTASLLSPVRSTSRHRSDVFGARVACPEGRNAGGGGGGRGERMSSLLPVPETPPAVEWPATGAARAVPVWTRNAGFDCEPGAAIWMGAYFRRPRQETKRAKQTRTVLAKGAVDRL